MRKKTSSLDASFIISGLGAGEHSDSVQELKDIIRDFGREQVDTVSVRLRTMEYPEEMFYEVARIAKENKLYFGFLYAYQFPPKGKESHLTAEIIAKVKEIAGEYFMGELLGEAGSDKGAKAKGYFSENPDCLAMVMPPQNFENLTQAKDFYITFIKKMTDYDKKIGTDTLLIEATAFSKYNLEGGVDVPALEVMPGNPEQLISFVRGAAIGYERKKWGGFIANEWYGGYFHEDKVKEKRLELAYKYLYMSGANIVYLESGYAGLHSFGYDFPAEAPESAAYREKMKQFHEFISSDKRLPCGPVSKVAFLHGNLDGYTGFMGSSIFSQFDKKEWGASSPEYTWNILDKVYRSCDWCDFTNLGKDGEDYSGAPAYGQYEVLPVESPLSVMQNYELLIFAGWNTMTDEIYEKLKAYVHGGGKLIISMAHLNVSDVRGANPKYIKDGKYADFLGFDVVGADCTNDGVKFRPDGLAEGVYYPGAKNYVSDCNFGKGYVDHVLVDLKGGRAAAFFENKFFPAPEDIDKVRAAVVENKYGKGVVTTLTYVDYPGNPAAYTVYETVVKSNLTATHRNCDLRVTGSDKVRFALYFDEMGNEKLYLLNTEFSVSQNVLVHYRGKTQEVSVPPIGLTWIDFPKE